MTQKRARHLMLELARRIHLEQNGNLNGFGKIAKHYRDNWRPDFTMTAETVGAVGYDGVWNCDLMKDIRKTVGM